MGNDYSYLSISKNENGFRISQIVCRDAPNNGAEEVMDEQPLADSIVYLRVTVTAPEAKCSFSYSEDGKRFKQIGKPFIAKPDRWMGAKVGLFCTGKPEARTGGYADIDWFRIDKDSQ